MGWREWPSWLKGGIIGVIVNLVLTSLIIGINSFSDSEYGVVNILILGLVNPHYFNIMLLPIGFFSAPVIYFLIGSFIGWRRSKNRNPKT